MEWWNENGAGIMAKMSCIRETSAQAPAGLGFYTSANVDSTANSGEGAWTEKMRITSVGKVGIGTTNPGYLLDVNGTANIGGALTGTTATFTTVTAALVGNATTSTNTTGNAATATVLATARTIGGVSFNGSANINLPGVNSAGNQNTTGSSGSCTGNAATATALATGRTIAMTGDVTWTSSAFDGSGTVTGVGTIATDAVDIAMLSASGTPSASTYLCGNNTWATPTGNTGNGTITLSAGTNLSGGGNFTTNQSSNETITFNMSEGGVGVGTYGSTSNGTKIDTITLDAYGRVTAVATGTTGSVTSVATTGAITGGTITSSGTIAHSTSPGYKHIPSGGSSGQFLKYSYPSSGTAVWASAVTSVSVGTGLDVSSATTTPNITLSLDEVSAGLKVHDGSATTPSYNFNNDTNTGMYRIADDVIGFAAGGTHTLAIENGMVGIGTTDPLHKLEVYEGSLLFKNTQTAPNDTAIRVECENNDITLMRFDASADQVDNSGQYGFSLKYMGARSGNHNSFSIFSDNQNAGTQVEALTVFQDGKVGIGITNPTSTPSTMFRVDGSISGTSKNFDIPHPDPSKLNTRLIHASVEAPSNDTLYRFEVITSEDKETVTHPLPDYFKYLNKDPQMWIQARNMFSHAYGSCAEDLSSFSITGEKAGSYDVLIIATRKDEAVEDFMVERDA